MADRRGAGGEPNRTPSAKPEARVRWVHIACALAVYAVAGCALIGLGAWDVYADGVLENKPVWTTLIENAVTLGIGIGCVWIGLWIVIHPHDRRITGLSQWTVGTALFGIVITLLIVGMQYLQMEWKPWILYANFAGVLLLGGFVTGRYATSRQAEKERAEAANTRAQRLVMRLENAQRMARMGSWSRDLVTDRLWWSDEVYRIFGLDPATFDPAYGDFVRFIHPGDRETVEADIAKSIAGEHEHAITFRIVRPDGETRWVREKAELIQDTDGTALALDGVIQDITEQEARKTALQAAKDRAEAASEQNRRLAARLQKAQRIARIGSWSWDLATNELWWSEEIYRIFGLDPDQFAATYDAFLARVHPEDRDAVARNVENALSGNQPYTIDHRIVRPDGVERTVREEAEILFDEHGQATVMDGVVQDITEDQERETELRAAKERAEEAAVAKSRFLAMMSHELRTPLNAIIGFGDLIAREAFGPLGSERYREYAADIHASGQHLLDVINDVLEMSRMETGGAELAEETVALGEVVNNAVRLVGEKANRHGISITTDVDPQDLAIVGDLPRVRQILFNLIDNAIKFSDRNSQIRVRADRTDEGCARLHVTDQGGGIPEHIKPRITDAFTQASETLSRNRDGIGLGLSLVKAFAELHGGSLEIDSEVGRGTTMTVVFPVERTLADGGSRSAAE